MAESRMRTGFCFPINNAFIPYCRFQENPFLPAPYCHRLVTKDSQVDQLSHRLSTCIPEKSAIKEMCTMQRIPQDLVAYWVERF